MPRISVPIGLTFNDLDDSCVSGEILSFIVTMASQLLPLGRLYGCLTGLSLLTTLGRID